MKRVLPFLLLFFCSQAEAKIFIKPFDSIGVRASSDISASCDNGKIWKSSGAGVWTCADDATGAGANITVKENDSSISAAVTTLDLGVMLDGTNSPAGEINISVDLTEAASANGLLPLGNGSTTNTTVSNDAVLVGNNAGTGYDQPALPNCIDSGGNHLNYTASTNTWSCGTTGDGTGSAGFSLFVSEDASAVGGTQTADYYLFLGPGLDVTGSGQRRTISIDLIEVSGDQTISDGSTRDIDWNFDLSAGDQTMRIQNGSVAFSGDVYISGDDLFMATNTDRLALIADGTNFNPEAIDLGTDTTGSYAAGDAEAGNALTGDSATSFFSAGTIEVARGGTALGSVSNDAVLVGNNAGTGYDQPALPNCTDSGGNHLNYTATTNAFSCGTTGDGTGSGKFNWVISPQTAKLPLARPAQIDAGTPGWKLLFDATAGETVSFDTLITNYNGGGNLSSDIYYSMASATSNKISVSIYAHCTTPRDAEAIDGAGYGGVSNNNQTVPGTAGYMDDLGVLLGNPDSCANGDRLRIMVSRDVISTDDTATGDLEIRGIRIYEV